MLERVETERGQRSGIGVAENSKNTAFFPQAVIIGWIAGPYFKALDHHRLQTGLRCRNEAALKAKYRP
jgi:hypothetical protein